LAAVWCRLAYKNQFSSSERAFLYIEKFQLPHNEILYSLDQKTCSELKIIEFNIWIKFGNNSRKVSKGETWSEKSFAYTFFTSKRETWSVKRKIDFANTLMKKYFFLFREKFLHLGLEVLLIYHILMRNVYFLKYSALNFKKFPFFLSI
jgi:hypothetical protein